MTAYVLERSQTIPAPLEDAFRFFEEPGNLAKITPAWLDFKIVDVGPLPLQAGSQINYRIRWLGIPRVWRTVIEEFERPHRFVDVQVKGPYRRWCHEHRFEARGNETVMRDRVQYELPYGILGRIAHWALVGRQLRQIFDYRSARIDEIFPRG